MPPNNLSIYAPAPELPDEPASLPKKNKKVLFFVRQKLALRSEKNHLRLKRKDNAMKEAFKCKVACCVPRNCQ